MFRPEECLESGILPVRFKYWDIMENSVKNKFFTDKCICLANIVPTAQISQAEKGAWLLIYYGEI